MKIQKHIVWVVSGSAALILIVVALFMLYHFYSTYDRVNKELQSTMSRLRFLQASDPYPSRENAAILQTNLVIFQRYYEGLLKFLRQGQFEPVETEAAKFSPLLRDAILRISARAQVAGVILPATFAMGMERYKRGDLPSQTDVPRLLVQLSSIEALCTLMIDAKIVELVSVRRGIFEQGAESQETSTIASGRWARRGTGGVSPPPDVSPVGLMRSEVVDSSGLFSMEHYVMDLKCLEGSVWDILNALAKSRLFAVVTSIAIVNDSPVQKVAAKQSVQPATVVPGAYAAATTTTEGQKAEMNTQDERVIAGREVVNVVMDIDVYRFLGGEKQEAKQ